MDHKAEVDFGFASFSDRTFELIARNIKTGNEITLYGTLRPEQTIDQIDQVLPTCVYVRGATISRLTAERDALQADLNEANARFYRDNPYAAHNKVLEAERDAMRKALEPFAAMASVKGGTPQAEKLRAVLDAITDQTRPGDLLDVIGAFCDAVLGARAALATTSDTDAEQGGGK